MLINLQEAIPCIDTYNFNCLTRNGITTYEELARMTDYDLAQLKYSPKLFELIELRNKAKYYLEFKQRAGGAKWQQQ